MADVYQKDESSIIQELVQANVQLKAELLNTSKLSQRFEIKARELKTLLVAAQERALAAEDEEMRLASARSERGIDSEQLYNGTRLAATKQARALERRCRTLEDDLIRTRVRLQKLENSEAERVSRTAEVFRRVKHRGAADYDPLDNKLLDVIDAYEREVASLRREIDFMHSCATHSEIASESAADILQPVDSSEACENASAMKNGEVRDQAAVDASLHAVIKELRAQLRIAAERNGQLEESVELVRLELQSRPSLKDHLNVVHKLKKCEASLKHHGITAFRCTNLRRKKGGSGGEESGLRYSTLVEDLDFLPLSHCRALLHDSCAAVQLQDTALLPSEVARLHALCVNELVVLRCLKEQIVQLVDAPLLTKGEEYDRKENDALVEQLKAWQDQLSAAPQIRHNLNRLSTSAFPWHAPLQLSEDDDLWSVLDSLENLIKAVEQPPILVDVKGECENAPASTLAALVEHFQRLFGVPRLVGVYPRMTQLYRQVEETKNTLAALRSTLGIPSCASVPAIMEAVYSIVRNAPLPANNLADQLRAVDLRVEDLEPILERLQEYDEFFPVFEALVLQLKEMLGLTRVDAILPAVRALKTERH